jgi:hypothetical protein
MAAKIITMNRSVIAFVAFLLLLCPFGCKRNRDLRIETFIITWENVPSFDDAPQFFNTAIDRSTQRFMIPKDPGDAWYFKSGRIEVALPGGPPEVRLRKIAETIATAVLKEKSLYTIDVVQQSRFGHYLHISWGAPEENYRGHYLNVMVNFENKVIWWNKCD